MKIVQTLHQPAYLGFWDLDGLGVLPEQPLGMLVIIYRFVF